MEDSKIDQAIMAALSDSGGHWTKVAMVIGRVGQELGSEHHDYAARRIEALVQEGRLEAQGALRKWRFSEVRLAH